MRLRGPFFFGKGSKRRCENAKEKKRKIFMKFTTLALAASVALAVASPAYADTIAINLGSAAIAQNAAQATNQVAGSVAVAVGSVSGSSEVASTAISGVNMANLDVDVTQAGSLFNGNGMTNAVSQSLQNATNQASLSLAGSGSVSNYSSLSSMAANLANNATVNVTVHQ